MRIDHLAYRVKNRDKAIEFFVAAFGYKVQEEFEITLEDGSKARSVSMEPSEKINPDMEFITVNPMGAYHLAPEVFVSDGPSGSIIDNWVNTWGHGIGGVHHIAYQVEDVRAKMAEWIAKGWLFTTKDPLVCEDLTQVFSKPSPITGIIYEFIERKGQRGFCKNNVAKLMSSTAEVNNEKPKP